MAPVPAPVRRRALLLAAAATALQGAKATPDGGELLRAGGIVLLLRHALAPGTFDPPGFRLGDCRTQRNLSDDGREQARGIGRWFADRRLAPGRVRSSPWCRCIDTAQLAFGQAEPWAALASPVGRPESSSADALQAMRTALGALAGPRAPFEVWVTHMFVQQALAGSGTGSGEGLIVRAGPSGTVDVLARWSANA